MMPVAQTWPDFSTQAGVATGAADAALTVPTSKGSTQSLTTTSARDHMSLWFLCVSGVACHVNQGNPATTAMAEIPVGMYGPFEFPTGTVIHAITDGGTGFIGIIRARLT